MGLFSIPPLGALGSHTEWLSMLLPTGSISILIMTHSHSMVFPETVISCSTVKQPSQTEATNMSEKFIKLLGAPTFIVAHNKMQTCILMTF
jgi:hypothetical protein